MSQNKENNKEAGRADIALRLIKGESVLLGNDQEFAAKKQTEDELYNYYRTQLFVANNTPLDNDCNSFGILLKCPITVYIKKSVQ